MSESGSRSNGNWIDPDDAPEWTEEQFERAEIKIGDKVIRPADGTLTRPGRREAASVVRR